jgi:hypothetical protein
MGHDKVQRPERRPRAAAAASDLREINTADDSKDVGTTQVGRARCMCPNCIVRTIGTRNYPNRKERRLGRGETQAKLIAAGWQRYSCHDLENFADQLESEPPEHAALINLLPPGARDPLNDASTETLRADHAEVFDLTPYEDDQSRRLKRWSCVGLLDALKRHLAEHHCWPVDTRELQTRIECHLLLLAEEICAARDAFERASHERSRLHRAPA